MDTLLALAVGLTFVAALIAALRAGSGATPAEVERRTSASERRLLEEIDRLRQALLGAQRDDARASARGIGELGVTLERNLRVIRETNAAALMEVRDQVDARLSATLETRLGESFRLVSERLEDVAKGLGEMRSLASGVGDLKRVLSNVKARGTFGEVQLGGLIDQVLVPSQFATNVATVPGSSERVEYAIRLPGQGHGTVWLPIDAKFPQEDYVRLGEAQERGDAAGAEEARRGLKRRLVAEAAKIRDKYVSPPDTTDFALMFLPTEGLFAEALRLPGLVEELQSGSRVVVVGPTTLYAVLSSLQMGFRTLAIEQRTSEVRRVLGSVKTEFSRFGASLDAVSKKLSEATAKIDETSRRTRAVERTLAGVESSVDTGLLDAAEE